MNICIILYHIFSYTKALMCFTQQPCEVACYSQIKGEENESQRHEGTTWKCPDGVSISITKLDSFFAIYSDLCLCSVSSKHRVHQLLQTFASKGKKIHVKISVIWISHHIGPIKTRAGHVNSQSSSKLFGSIEESEEQEQNKSQENKRRLTEQWRLVSRISILK